MIGEYDSSGVAIAEHIYLGSTPVAVVKSGTIYYVHTDHLGTPRVITNTSGTVVWKWDNTNAYGYNSANETVSGPTFEYNIRFAGQYFDKESGLHYNYHRMYNPELGRYIQPDPIGISGGMNLYSYVENNPLNASDPYGLSPQDVDKIQNIFRKTINYMVKNGERRSSDSYLPNNGFPLLGKKKFQTCEEQITTMQISLNNPSNTYDDNWIFKEQSGWGHFWMIAISSNKKDPIIYLDPWKDSIGIGEPCKGCGGWFGRDFDYNQFLINKANKTENSNGWYEGWDITRPNPKGIVK